MIAVIHRESGKEISYHKTINEAIIAIHNYQRIDHMDGTFEPNKYEWKFTDDES